MSVFVFCSQSVAAKVNLKNSSVDKYIYINFFKHGNYVVSYQGQAELLKLCSKLKSNPPKEVSILGYTDSIERTLGINLVISQYRAEAVANFLRDHECLVGIKFSKVKGRGGRSPLYDNSSEAGREKNRRIEVLLEY